MLRKILVGAGMAYLGRKLMGKRGKPEAAVPGTGGRGSGIRRSW